MWHSAAYSQSLTGPQTNTALPAVNDSIFKIGSQNGFVLQEDMMLISALANGINLSGARLLSPKLNQFTPWEITPFNALGPLANPLLQARWPYRPFTFRNQEEVTAKIDETGVAADQLSIIVDFSNGIDPIPPGEELLVKATSTTAAVAAAWTQLTYTLSQTLPEGIYALLASEVFSTNAIYHRWTFWNQFYRPGFPSSSALGNQQSLDVQELRKGLAGRFSNVTLPNLEVFCNGTDAAHTILMRVIKVQ